MKHLRILPIFIFVIVLAFSIRLSHVVVDARNVYFEFQKQTANAASNTEDEADEDHAEVTDEKDHADTNEKAVSTKSAEGKTDLNWRDSVEDDFDYEITRDDYVSDLEAQREKLDGREKNLAAKEALLKAAQQEMNRKYNELNQLRKQLEGLLEEQQGQEKKQIDNLVRIYEGMKAKEAAKIFNTLDIDVLISVLMNMSERKAAAVLAKMSPERAKTVTVMLAQQKSLPSL